MKTILYISDVNASEPIFHSQVLPHLNELREFYNVKLLGMSRGEDYQYDFTYQSTSGDYVKSAAAFNLKKNYNALNNFLKENEFDMIYSRGIRGGILGGLIKNKFYLKKISLINDVRGDVLDEHKNNYLKLFLLNQSNKFVFENSDKLFFVSSYLKEKYCKKYNLSLGAAYVCPTFVPDNKFDFNEKNRIRIRKNLEYSSEDIVIVYSGNLARWQNIELVLKAFSNSTNMQLKLLILTKATNIMDVLKKSNCDLSRISTKNVTYEDIEKYYHAGDFGILIRDNTDTNKCAAPTKFSEYVNSGLALIINRIESDYVDTFENLKIEGVVLEGKEDLNKYFNKLNLSLLKRNYLKINVLSDVVNIQHKAMEE